MDRLAQGPHFRHEQTRTRAVSPGAPDGEGAPGVIFRRLVLAVALLSLIAVGAACASSKPKASDSPSTGPPSTSPTKTSTSPTASPSPTIDPQAQPAVSVYLKFWSTSNAAFAHPFSGTEPTPAEDFTKYSFDPALGTGLAFVSSLASSGAAYRGTPPRARVKVTAINLAAKPYPTVVMTNCPTLAPTWQEYIVKTSAAVPQQKQPVPPPYLITVQVIQYRGHWGVQKVTPEAKTCTA